MKQTQSLQKNHRPQKVHIGIGGKDREKIAKGLKVVLANTYALYLKTQNFHWNVTGPEFNSLHKMFENHYKELAEDADLLAERIRALGFFSPGSFSEFQKLSQVPEETKVPPAAEMIAQLVEGREIVVKSTNKILPFILKHHDEPTSDLLIRQMEDHEKAAWMLRSLLN